jgi:hypothetical protein
MRRFARCLCSLCSLVGLAACATSPRRATTDSAGGAVGAAAVSAADFAGTWTGRSYASDAPNDTGSVYTYVRGRGASGQDEASITFASGQQLPVRVLLTAGDSAVNEMGPYHSDAVGRDVITRAVTRVRNGKLVGTYETRIAGTDSVVERGRFEASRTTP